MNRLLLLFCVFAQIFLFRQGANSEEVTARIGDVTVRADRKAVRYMSEKFGGAISLVLLAKPGLQLPASAPTPLTIDPNNKQDISIRFRGSANNVVQNIRADISASNVMPVPGPKGFMAFHDVPHEGKGSIVFLPADASMQVGGSKEFLITCSPVLEFSKLRGRSDRICDAHTYPTPSVHVQYPFSVPRHWKTEDFGVVLELLDYNINFHVKRSSG